MKVAIIGSRTFTDYEKFKEKINELISLVDVFPVILTGDADGADALARKYADRSGFDLIVFKPINRYVKDAYNLLANDCYYARNKQMVDNCDILIAFWDGESGGTKMTINYAKSIHVPVKIIQVEV